MLVTTKVQTYFCHDKTFVMTNICHKTFVATSLLLSQQTRVRFVTTKMILVAASADDSSLVAESDLLKWT